MSEDYRELYLKEKQLTTALRIELGEIIKAVDRYRRLYADPVYVRMFGREVTMDFDDPLYPYCPFRLKEEEITMYQKLANKDAQK